MIENDKLILVGVITAAKGIKGEALIKSFTQEKMNIINLNLVDDQAMPVKLKFVRANNKEELICRINDLHTRNDVEKLRGVKLFCLRSDLPILEQNEFYITDLKDKAVVDKSYKPIGIVQNILNFGADDLVEIKFNNGQKELFSFNVQNFPEVQVDYLVFVPPAIST